ncbi:MAG TPA: glycosyltransferase [Deltaproteobacteria bacterium]|nr:glycosyltransferase [Deltaproteobacteria bacterium]
MRVIFNTYPVAFDCPGGGEIQLCSTRSAVEAAGVEVLLYDQWRPRLDDADLVHYFSVQGGSMNFCSHVKRRGLPLVISPIIWLGRDRDSYPLGEIRDLLHLADMILPNSAAEAGLLREFFSLPEEKFTVTHNGVDRSFAAEVAPALFRERFGIEGPFVFNAANVEPRKNQLSLVRALKGTGMRLVIAGGVRDRAYFEACMAEGGGFTAYVGRIAHEDDLLKSAYGGCELFVLPSLLETPGLSALEAAAAGARLVVTAVGSAREYFGDEAVYVDPYDVDDIRRGIGEGLARERGGALRRLVTERYTWENTAAEVVSAYEAVLGRRREAGGGAGEAAC